MSDIIASNTLKNHLIEQYGEELADKIAAGYLETRPVTLRSNALKTSADTVKERLSCLGIAFHTVDWYGDALVLDGVREADLYGTELYERGEIYLQSLSSMLPPLFLEPQAGERILDMTAAPGGKTTQISALSGGKALITACEKNGIRADRLRYNIARQGAPSVQVMQTDAEKLDDFFRFDKILLDAPCSGSGTLSPQKGDFSEKTLAGCMRAQERLIAKAAKLLKSGGTMIYSTCSVLKQENEDILAKAMRTSALSLVPITCPQNIPVLPSLEGTICVCPNRLYEGFFIAKLQKK